VNTVVINAGIKSFNGSANGSAESSAAEKPTDGYKVVCQTVFANQKLVVACLGVCRGPFITITLKGSGPIGDESRPA
jgi:hypothetical protein